LDNPAGRRRACGRQRPSGFEIATQHAFALPAQRPAIAKYIAGNRPGTESANRYQHFSAHLSGSRSAPWRVVPIMAGLVKIEAYAARLGGWLGQEK